MAEASNAHPAVQITNASLASNSTLLAPMIVPLNGEALLEIGVRQRRGEE